MKKARLIYNPYSGNRSFRQRLDYVIEMLQKSGYEVTPYRTMSIQDIYNTIEESIPYDAIIVSGGDGTINHVINAMMQHNIDLPVGIIPSGTSNDFANHLGIPLRFPESLDIIAKNKTSEIDLGRINDRYFVNVTAAGLLTDVSQKIDINMKNTLGKMAYYIKGIEQIPNFRPIHVSIECENKKLEEKLYLFVILNGSSAGGFKLAPDSNVLDGTLKFVGIKMCSMVDLINLFIKMLKGEHLDSSNIVYLKGSEFTVNCMEKIETDIDGEIGPEFPLNVKLSEKKLNVFVP
jgi:diacylglycerol kinase (ATP)